MDHGSSTLCPHGYFDWVNETFPVSGFVGLHYGVVGTAIGQRFTVADGGVGPLESVTDYNAGTVMSFGSGDGGANLRCRWYHHLLPGYTASVEIGLVDIPTGYNFGTVTVTCADPGGSDPVFYADDLEFPNPIPLALVGAGSRFFSFTQVWSPTSDHAPTGGSSDAAAFATSARPFPSGSDVADPGPGAVGWCTGGSFSGTIVWADARWLYLPTAPPAILVDPDDVNVPIGAGTGVGALIVFEWQRPVQIDSYNGTVGLTTLRSRVYTFTSATGLTPSFSDLTDFDIVGEDGHAPNPRNFNITGAAGTPCGPTSGRTLQITRLDWGPYILCFPSGRTWAIFVG